MKKIVLYCVSAAILGIILIVGPFFALAMLELMNEPLAPSYLQEWMLQKPGRKTYGSDTYSQSNLDIGVFALCFFIALAAYLLFKRMV
ncbi:MAG: hypothetical protein QXV21_05290 [Candidatus Bathyarchaeia archaeon]